jgi:hypothetical protein
LAFGRSKTCTTVADRTASSTGASPPSKVPGAARAVEVPGLGTLNKGGDAFVTSVSCAPAGTCAAGGHYAGRHDHSQGFVVSQTG